MRAAGITQNRATVASAVKTGSPAMEWKSMWDEVLNGISDGRELSKADAEMPEQLKGQAAEHTLVWDSQTGKQLTVDRWL